MKCKGFLTCGWRRAVKRSPYYLPHSFYKSVIRYLFKISYSNWLSTAGTSRNFKLRNVFQEWREHKLACTIEHLEMPTKFNWCLLKGSWKALWESAGRLWVRHVGWRRKWSLALRRRLTKSTTTVLTSGHSVSMTHTRLWSQL